MKKFSDKELVAILKKLVSKESTSIKEGLAIVMVLEKAGLKLWK